MPLNASARVFKISNYLKKNFKLGWLILLIIALILLHLYSQFANWSYPRADDADFFDTAHKIWLNYKKHGMMQFLYDLYWIRTWKPIQISSLHALFLSLNEGRVVEALRFHNLFFLVLTAFNFFRICKTLISNTTVAILGTLILISLPPIFAIFETYTAEVVLVASVSGFFSAYANSRRGSESGYLEMIIWLFLGMANRPLEMATILLPIFLIESIRSFRSDPVLTLSNAAMIFSIPALASVHYFYRSAFPISISVFLSILILFQFVLAGFLYWKRFNRFLLFTLLASTLVAIWYAPYSAELVHWVFQSSIGTDAKVTGGRNGISIIQYWYYVFSKLGGFSLMVITSLFILVAIFLIFLSAQEFKAKLREVSYDAKLIGVCSLTAIGLSGLAKNADLRYHCISIALLFLVLIYLSFHFLKINLTRFFNFSLALVLASHFFIQLKVIDISSFGWTDKYIPNRISFRTPSYLKTDPIIEFANEVVSALKNYQNESIEIISMNTNWNTDQVWNMDVWALRIVVREKGIYNWNFTRPFLRSPVEDEIKQKELFQQRASFVLVGPLKNVDPRERNPGDFVAPIAFKIINLFAQGKTIQFGLKPLAILKMKDRHNESDQALLFQVNTN